MTVSIQNSSQDVVELKTESSKLVTAGIITFLTLFVGLGLWMYFASIQGAVIASGSVSVLGKPKTVQHLDGGIVATINVENGASVEAGSILMQLDDTILKSNLDIYKNRFREAVSRRDRLAAERDGVNSLVFNDEPFVKIGFPSDQEFEDGQRAIFKARQATYDGQVTQLNEKIRQLGNQIDGLKALSVSKMSQIEILNKELTAIRSLAKDGYASENRVLGLERQVQELTGQQHEHTSEIARVQNSIAEVRVQIAQIRKEFDQSVLMELRDVGLSIKDMEQQILATQEQLKRIDIKAPIAGIVHEQSIFTIGGVIAPGGAILQIIPQGQEMEFEVNVEPQNIDEIYVGQDVSIMFSAFNARTTPQLNGTVENVSINTSVQPETGLPFYPVRVIVSQDEMDRLGDQKLVSGMPIEAFFTTQSRSPLNYLVKPLTDNLKRAAREE